MKLKSIELMGFKSFPDKTNMTFDSGLTAIVGPNGSGKSNVSDAVRWVLGEMSLKSLRGTRMEDIIFNGTQKRNAANYAYVSLFLDTSEEFSKGENNFAQWEEVVITRKYYRSGESEYYINKKQVRLKDIYELFYDTGIGREGYSVIGQGKISEVLSARGDERRDIFEEAAGISKYRYKKTEAERKLRDTENNLVRVNDILGELDNRLAPLEKEAENAKKYLALSQEKKELEVTLWLDKIDRLKTELDGAASTLAALQLEFDNAESDVKQAQESMEEFTNQGYALMQKRGELDRSASNAQVEIENHRGKIVLNKSEINHIEDKIKLNEIEISAIKKNKTSATEQEYELLNALKKSEIDFENAVKLKESAVLHYNESRKKTAEAAQAEEEPRSKAEAAAVNIAEINGEIVRAKTMAENAERLRESYESRVAASREAIKSLNTDLEQINNEIKIKTHQLDKICIETSAFEEENAQITLKIKNLNAEISAQNVKIAQKEQEREGLIRLEKLFEGYSDAVKILLKHNSEGKLKGITVHGTVASIFTADSEHAVAIETALGGSSQFIIVETEQDAKNAIKYLKEIRGGRATFLPVQTIKGRKADIRELKNPVGFIGIASDLVRCESRFRGIAENLLGRTLITQTLDDASNIAKETSYRHKIVTSDGQVINAGGSYTGGSSPQKAGLFTRTIDMERLDCEIRELNKNLMDSEFTLKKLTEKTESINNEAALKRTEISCLITETEEQKRKKSALEARCDHESNHLAKLTESVAEDETGRSSLGLLIKELEEKQLLCKKEQSAYLAALEECKKAYTEARNLEEAALKTQNTAEIAEITARSAKESCQNAVNELKNRMNSDILKLDMLQKEISANQIQAKKINEEIQTEEAFIDLKLTEIEEYRNKIDEINEKLEQRETFEAELKSNLKDASVRKEQAFQSRASIELKHESSGSEHQRLADLLWDEYELTYSEACQFRLPPEKTVRSPSRLNVIKNQIRTLGAINVNAVEEYRVTKERHDFLKSQTDDLNATRKSLDNAISKLNNTMRTVFTETFNKINIEFNEVFTELFGGGSAKIELTEPDNPLESGIDIILRLPGKSVKNIALLSGGEQSFAAIALYLALQNINPSPFCIFDEIETALDDVNLARFADYIKRHCDKTQYIVITHRRGTMERADTIYGVTMREKGVSEYLKLNINAVMQ